MGHRSLLVHLHMFKNAGTTIDSALKASFGECFVEYDGSRPGHRVTADEFRNVVLAHPDATALSSHQLRLPLPTLEDVAVLPLVFLREPLDRAQSVWSFERRQRANSPGAIHAKKLSVDDYVRWRLGQAEVSVISDFQAGVLGRDQQTGEVSITLAATRLAMCEVVGVVERMPESMLVAEWRLRQAAFADIDLSFVSRNVSPDRGATAGERVERFFEMIGPSLSSELRLRNARDVELYELANRELDRGLAEIPDLAAAREDFDRRCSARRGDDAGSARELTQQ